MSSERERREHILAVAERLLRHYGPQKTTIAEIAKAADVGVGTVYLEFPSKEAIVEELSQLRHGAVLDAMQRAARSEVKQGGFGERIRAVFDAKLAAFKKLEAEGAHARDLVHCINAAVRAAHARFKAAEIEIIADLLRRGESAGDIVCVAGTPEDTAKALLQAYATFAPPYVFEMQTVASDEIDRKLDAMHALVLRGILRRDRVLNPAHGKKRGTTTRKTQT